ncbi:MAG TPA: HAMP domain-containing sensor histidine kinase [Thermoleophilia bacterium]|nr:HAMP domain-containing sensor histidine kinase [Thermoleophilia bacterium]
MKLPIQVRLTAVYVFTAALLTAIGAILFQRSVHLGLTRHVDAQLKSRAIRVSRTVKRAGPSAVHTMTPVGANVLVEVIDPKGRFAVGSPELGGVTLLDTAQQAAAAHGSGGYQNVGAGPDYRVYVQPATTADGVFLAVAATPLDTQNALTDTVTGYLFIAVVVVVVLGGVGAWLLAGAALRPVEQLRRQVAQLSGNDPSSPLYVPGTGDEIAALAESVNGLLARFSAGLARQRRFVADASHEVRTPLANLRTTLELATRRVRTAEELTEAVRYCEGEVIRLGQLVDDLLVLAAADEKVPLSLLPDQRALPLLEAAAMAARPTADAKCVDVVVDADPGASAALNPGMIRQVLDNLLSNAVRHAPPGSRIVLTAQARPDSLLISVEDEGPGFPDGFAEQAFERFKRAEDEALDPAGEGVAAEAGGTGLGLAVVRAIARAHGGDAEAGNGPSGGAVVSVRLPRGV